KPTGQASTSRARPMRGRWWRSPSRPRGCWRNDGTKGRNSGAPIPEALLQPAKAITSCSTHHPCISPNMEYNLHKWSSRMAHLDPNHLEVEPIGIDRRHDPEVRRRMSEAAMRTFLNIARAWSLTVDEQRGL